MTKKRTPSAAELERDPSLRHTPYLRWEVLWSFQLNRSVRFLEYENCKIRAAEVNSLSEIGDLLLDPTAVCRMSAIM